MSFPSGESPLGGRAVEDALFPIEDSSLTIQGVGDFLGKLGEQRATVTKTAPSLERLGGQTPAVGKFMLAQIASPGIRFGRGNGFLASPFSPLKKLSW
jgi:hypothetical protein